MSTDAFDGRGSSTWRSPAAVFTTCAVLALGGAIVSGCGDDQEPTAAGAQSTSTEQISQPAEETDTIEISDFKFDPEAVTVEAGTEISWTNSDEAPHTATADDGSFDTGTLDLDDEGTAKFDEPGTYSYYCRFHAFMKGTVEVQ